MRVIAGSAKSIQLVTPEGMDTRPTTDRIKETLFNMIQYDLTDCIFLDLFAGSGAIGIEALSRGASKCFFVESAPGAVKCIRENLKKCRLEDRAVVLQSDVFGAVTSIRRESIPGGVLDFVFMDPPYRKEIEKKVLELLSHSSIINNRTSIITEASLDTDFSYLDDMGYHLLKEKKYKTNKHMFIERF